MRVDVCVLDAQHPERAAGLTAPEDRAVIVTRLRAARLLAGRE
jgi:hypothetical protein